MTKHEYICKVCDIVREKSDCFKRKVGAIFVNSDYEILATGYNQPPRGFEHCDRISGLSKHTCGNPCSRNIHAEINAIIQAAKRGTSLKDSILYCTYTPCINCSRALVNLGVTDVFAKETNNDGGAIILKEALIPLKLWI